MSDATVTTPQATKHRFRVEIKLSEEQKALIARAAGAARKSLSEFVRDAAESAAQKRCSA